jgi:hypothetical protein
MPVIDYLARGNSAAWDRTIERLVGTRMEKHEVDDIAIGSNAGTIEGEGFFARRHACLMHDCLFGARFSNQYMAIEQ